MWCASACALSRTKHGPPRVVRSLAPSIAFAFASLLNPVSLSLRRTPETWHIPTNDALRHSVRRSRRTALHCIEQDLTCTVHTRHCMREDASPIMLMRFVDRGPRLGRKTGKAVPCTISFVRFAPAR